MFAEVCLYDRSCGHFVHFIKKENVAMRDPTCHVTVFELFNTTDLTGAGDRIIAV